MAVIKSIASSKYRYFYDENAEDRSVDTLEE